MQSINFEFNQGADYFPFDSTEWSDFDKDNLPEIKFDVIISLLSLDYHYDFNLYAEYLKKVSKPNTKIIFDTIRNDYFREIFKKVEIIRSDLDTVHKSKRIICSQFLD